MSKLLAATDALCTAAREYGLLADIEGPDLARLQAGVKLRLAAVDFFWASTTATPRPSAIEIELPSSSAPEDAWFVWFVQSMGRLMAYLPPSAAKLAAGALAEANELHPHTAPLGTAMLMQGVGLEVAKQNPEAPPAPPSWVDDVVAAPEEIGQRCSECGHHDGAHANDCDTRAI